jgi:hypothetical protein
VPKLLSGGARDRKTGLRSLNDERAFKLGYYGQNS